MASTLSFRAAVLFALIGMAWGVAMAASGNHQTLAAHAHLNLLGWVSLFLFGLFYHAHPRLDGRSLARLQVGVWIVAVVLVAVGVGLIPSAHPLAEPLASVGSLLAVADMLLFAVIVFRRPVPLAGTVRVAPAE